MPCKSATVPAAVSPGQLFGLCEALFGLIGLFLGLDEAVGDHQRGHQQQPPLGHLAELAQQSTRIGVEHRGEAGEMLLLVGATAQPVKVKTSGSVDLAHEVADLRLALESGEARGEGSLRYASSSKQ